MLLLIADATAVHKRVPVRKQDQPNELLDDNDHRNSSRTGNIRSTATLDYDCSDRRSEGCGSLYTPDSATTSLGTHIALALKGHDAANLSTRCATQNKQQKGASPPHPALQCVEANATSKRSAEEEQQPPPVRFTNAQCRSNAWQQSHG